MLNSARMFALLVLLAFPLLAHPADVPAGATITPGVPDLPPPDGCACADSALANVIKYFSEHGFEKLGQDGAGKKLSDPDLVRAVNKTDPGGGALEAAKRYIKEKGYQEQLVVHEQNDASFAAIVKELKKGQLVLLQLQVGLGLRHTVTVVGWSDAGGVQQIGIHDINKPDPASTDYTGSDGKGTDFYKIQPNGDGDGFRFDYGPFPFRTVSIVSVSPKAPEKPGTPTSETGKSDGNSVNFNAASKALSFRNDFITSTGFAGDPLVGATVSPPPLELFDLDAATRTALFRPTGSERFQLHFGTDAVLSASLGQMRYEGAGNTLVADLFDVGLAGASAGSPFFDAGLAALSSDWLDHISGILDPGSLGFQPDNVLHITYAPGVNLWDATNGFTVSADTLITNFLQTQHVVSEPSTRGMVAGCIVLLCLLRTSRNGSGRVPAFRPGG